MANAHVETLSASQDGSDGSLTVTLRVSPPPDGGRIQWVAAAPPERRASEAGSCLPFADERMAFEGMHAMRGTAIAEGDPSSFTVRLGAVPNAFYVGLGTERVPPSVFVSFAHSGRRMRGAAKVADGVPFRSLTYPALRPCASASLYDVPTRPARSQADILFASAFPRGPRLPLAVPSASAATPAQFWGGKPPV